MLDSIRQNLKGTLVVIVVLIFIVPMVISGVGTSFLGGSIGSEDVAKVGDESISQATLERAIRAERNRLLQQNGIDASSPLLEEGNIRRSVLDRLTRRAALVDAARTQGMAMSENEYSKVLSAEEAFFTDGAFDTQKFQTLLAQFGMTPYGYRQEVTNDILVQQQLAGIEQSVFVSEHEFAQLARLTHQKRSFYGITLPAVVFREAVEMSEDEISKHYEDNKQRYRVAEKVKLEYLELSLDELAQSVQVEEQDIRDQYDAEIAEQGENARYEVAHILIEDSDSERVSKIAEALEQGADFAELAKSESDDFGSSDLGGALGVMTPGAFPQAFEDAAKQLESGQVSAAVVTDSGTHFIKVLSKTTEDLPSFESRKEDIRNDLARVAAAEDYTLLVDRLADLTFSSEGLEEAANELNLEIKTSSYFEQNSAAGSGIAQFAKVRETAFSDEIKVAGNNSNTIELTPERSVVIRVADLSEAFYRPLPEVKNSVEASLRTVKTRELLEQKADELKAKLKNGEDPKTLASELNYTFEELTLASRDNSGVDFETMALAFRTEKPLSGVSFGEDLKRSGDYLLVGVSEVVDGKLSDIDDAQKQAIRAQLLSKTSSQESAAYIALVYGDAEISIND